MDEQNLNPPSMVIGLTPEDLLQSEADGPAMAARYGRDTAIALISMRRSRAGLVALLSGTQAPANQEQIAFLAAVDQGRPVSLLSPGCELLAGQGFNPTLRKTAQGWQWQVGPYQGLEPEPADALRRYAAMVNRVTG